MVSRKKWFCALQFATIACGIVFITWNLHFLTSNLNTPTFSVFQYFKLPQHDISSTFVHREENDDRTQQINEFFVANET